MRIRLNAFPIVVPKPRSNGSIVNLPYLSEYVSFSTLIFLEFENLALNVP